MKTKKAIRCVKKGIVVRDIICEVTLLLVSEIFVDV